MEGIVCAYYDHATELEHDMPFQPDLSEAIKAFLSFPWRPRMEPEDGIQMLMFNAMNDNGSVISLSCFEKEKWTISTSAVNRRRFFGPFFQKRTTQILFDLSQLEIEHWITCFFEDTREQFTARVKATLDEERNVDQGHLMKNYY